MELFGENILCGYDIGCGFSTTANRCSILGEQIQQKHFRFCVGSFHGYAHNRKCQLGWHPLYTKGTGLEDFEGCERIFADSNSLGGIVRHSSDFHRMQAIVRNYERWNNDKYAGLGTLGQLPASTARFARLTLRSVTFLKNNYKQALGIIANHTDELRESMQALGIRHVSVFEEYLEEERRYLASTQGAQTYTTEERTEMEYVTQLGKLAKHRCV